MENVINRILSDRKEILKQFSLSSDCKWFASKELHTLENLLDVFYHPQGIEFCQQSNFPSIEILRTFKALSVEKYGVYIDAGDIVLINPDKAILIGNTTANILCTEGGSNIIAMHSANIRLVAKEWAVVRLHYNEGCKIEAKREDRAIINRTYKKLR